MTTITTPGALEGHAITTVDFEDIASLDGKQFDFAAGQPYANIGLWIAPASVVSTANLNSSSGGVGVRSDVIYAQEYQNWLLWRFSEPQKAVGFFYRDTRATSVKIRAYDVNVRVVEEGTFPGGEGYAGLIRSEADIAEVSILSPHDTFHDADVSRAYIDDLSFAKTCDTLWCRWRSIIRRLTLLWTWLWTILVGYILLTPIGPVCIACGNPIADFWVRLLGGVVFVLGGIGFWRELAGTRTK